MPASAGADGCRVARGVGLLVARAARKAEGEAAASPARPGGFSLGLVPPDPVAALAHAVTRQAAARQAGTARVRPARLARVRPVLPVRVRLALLSG